MDDEERKRLEKMRIYEIRAKEKGFSLVAGTDEAGRGPLAGPVVAAACILPEHFSLEKLNDSKKLQEEDRENLYKQITHHPEVHFAVGIVDAKTIDRINIHNASLLAMEKSVQALKVQPDYLLVDGKHAPKVSMPVECIIKGDSHSQSIAAASIIAKCRRDWIMKELHGVYPLYHFDEHKGYATEKHQIALKKYGPSPVHRTSYQPIKDLIEPKLPF